MSNTKVTIHRYEHPEQVGWAGYAEPDDKSWIVFFAPGRAQFYGQRDPSDGSVIETLDTSAKSGA